MTNEDGKRDRMRDAMAGYVERGEVPGLITLVGRRGEVYVDVIGAKAVGGEPMRRDTIFRIASMTKPVAAAAAMVLVEEGKLSLDETVDRLLPELADRRVLKRLDGPLDDTVPAKRPTTARDLLTLRMGFGYIMEPSSEYPIQKAVNERRILQGSPKPQISPAPDEWMRQIEALPLMRQPGEAWMYDLGLDVLGVLIARAAKRDLPTFLRERIFEPLGMKDTAFSVPPDKLDRMASCYEVDETGTLELYDGVHGSQWSRPPAFPSAAGGLVSTADDFLAFGRMMLNKGAHGNERILSESSVEAMTTDQLTAEQRADAAPFLDGRGWGFGMSVRAAAVPGWFGWTGGTGVSWRSDPSEDMVAILMTQVVGFPSGIYEDFWASVYQVIDD